MAYIGKAPNTAVVNQATSQSFSGNGSTTAFTLTRSVNVGEDLEVFVNNVQQEPGSGKSYTASGTTLTFDEAPPSGTNNVYVIYRGEATINPRLEHDANAALAATTGTFTGDLTVDTNTLKVDATNNRVGVGTASPTQATLHVDGGSVPARFESTSNSTSYVQFGASGTSSYGQIAMTGDDMTLRTSYTDRMTILSGGNVGIGTSSPDRSLHIAGSEPSVVFENTGQGTDLKTWRIYSNSSSLQVGTVDDAFSAGQNALEITRDNTDNITGIQFKTGASTECMRLVGGKVYIGRTSDPYMSTGSVKRLSVDGGTTSTDATFVSNKNSASTMYHFYFHNSNSVVGSISTNAYATSFNTSSDHRLKENVTDITGAIARVKSLQPKRFNWITDPDDTTIDGFLAHECQTVVPEAINGTHNETRAATGIVKEAGGKVLAENVQQSDWTANKGDDDDDLYPSDSTWTASENLPVYQTIDQSKLVPLLTAALKESIAKIETLEAKVAALEGN